MKKVDKIRVWLSKKLFSLNKYICPEYINIKYRGSKNKNLKWQEIKHFIDNSIDNNTIIIYLVCDERGNCGITYKKYQKSKQRVGKVLTPFPPIPKNPPNLKTQKIDK